MGFYDEKIKRLQREILNLKTENELLQKDAARYRWLCDGNGYFMEEEMLCGHGNDKPMADVAIDYAIANGCRP